MNPFGLSDMDLTIIKDKLEEKKVLAKERSQALFGVFDEALSQKERVAVEFLYAFMPLVDLADYTGDLFLKHVRQSLNALREAPWGEKITGPMYLHYILPYRVSNETIEDYRPYFWNELFERVRDLSMADAILETNHWCHKKATYSASDPRTISPLALVRTAQGRCGEESAFLVAALRSLGIPARQVYTPRWAHTDSNHAWVEAWADGEWFFLGACEPEPRLNTGWFEGPAKRAMFLHTRVPGTIYGGPGEVVQVKGDFTELNLLPRYAPVRSLTVQVRDRKGQAIEGVGVELQVFNYGGFSSLVCLTTDHEGKVNITTGQGDLLIHAFKDSIWGSVWAPSNSPGTVEVVLGAGHVGPQQFTVHVPGDPPYEGIKVSTGEREENDRRLQEEDNIRDGYEATFIDKEQAGQIASELGVDPERVWAVLEKARGNGGEITKFLRTAVLEHGPIALELAGVLSAKDLADTTGEILGDHLEGSLVYQELYPADVFIRYVLQPRVSLETLRPYRAFFQSEFTFNEQEDFMYDPGELKQWIDKHIIQIEEGSLRGWPSPKGVYELKAGSALGKHILFVAMARSFGIPARLSPIDGQVQYYYGEDWIEVELNRQVQPGILRIHPPQADARKVDYFQDFSLARLEKGVFHTLRFRGLDEEAFNEESFSHRLELIPGLYRLTTGHRLTDGTVLANFRDFAVLSGKILDLDLVFAREPEPIKSLGRLPTDLECDKGVVLAWIDPKGEPSKHLIRDLVDRKAQIDALGSTVVIYLGVDTGCFDLDNYPDLPGNTHFAKDIDYQVFKRVQRSLQEALPLDFPVVVAADDQGVIRYVATGYQIGTAGHIVESLRKG